MYRLEIIIQDAWFEKSFGEFPDIATARLALGEVVKVGFWLNDTIFYPPTFIKRVSIIDIDEEKRIERMKEEVQKEKLKKPWYHRIVRSIRGKE